MSDDMLPWDRFIYTWGQVCDALVQEERYQAHLAEAADGTPLAAAMGRVMRGEPSAQDLIDFARWELWECLMNLDPEVPRDRGPGWVPQRPRPGHALPRIQDVLHAGCCALRAEGALHKLEKMLRGSHADAPPAAPAH